jgi:hypothetical protein
MARQLRGRSRGVAIGAVLVAMATLPRAARAGDAEELRILAATPDGALDAFVAFENGNVMECGLAKVGAKPPPGETTTVVKATCTEESGRLRPLEKWTWPAGTTQVSALRPFDEAAAGKTARIGMDVETYLQRIEVMQGGQWVVARPIEGDVPSLDGAIRSKDRVLLRVAFGEQLNDWHEVWSVTDAELAGAPARRAAARQDAREATARMREHRAKGTGVFAPAPAGTPKDKWEKRRRHGIATFIHKWEITAAYGPLDAGDLRDAFWLLGWFDWPQRHFEAMRLYSGLQRRDAAGAAAVLADLEKDPDTRALAAFLKATPDHLRGLPDIWQATDESLRALGNDQLLWLHRREWAEAGYHFSDPAVAAYFALIPGSAPMPDKRWKKLTADPAFLKDPDAPLVAPAAPQSMKKDGLAAILRAERARGLAKPSL